MKHLTDLNTFINSQAHLLNSSLSITTAHTAFEVLFMTLEFVNRTFMSYN